MIFTGWIWTMMSPRTDFNQIGGGRAAPPASPYIVYEDNPVNSFNAKQSVISLNIDNYCP